MEIHVPLLPETLFNIGPLNVTNTLLTEWIVSIILILFAWASTRNMKLVPSGLQNLAETIIELLLQLGEQVAGSRARSFLPLVATLFLTGAFGASVNSASGRAVRLSTWKAPGCSVARRKGRRPSPASATEDATRP